MTSEKSDNSLSKETSDALQLAAYKASVRDQEQSTRCFLACLGVFRVPDMYLDIGCGSGHMVETCHALQLMKRNRSAKVATGMDKNVIPVQAGSPGSILEIKQMDFNYGFREFEDRYDLITCWEVAEHLRPRLNADLVTFIENRLEWGGVLLFAAATPGQGGYGHINERPHREWIRDFESAGLHYDERATDDIRDILCLCCGHAYWYAANMQVYRKKVNNG